jgi:endonuclease YncB( thermonuclease family)
MKRIWSTLVVVVAPTLPVTSGLSIVPIPPPPRDIVVSSPQFTSFLRSKRTSSSQFSDVKDFVLMTFLMKNARNTERIGQTPLIPLFSSSSITTNLVRGSITSFSSLETDQVERILDANTIQLKKKGIVRLAKVRMPSTSSSFHFPECFTFSPSYKIRQLIPKSTVVRVQTVSSASSSNNQPPTVILVRDEDSVVVNRELVKTGFAKVINQSALSTRTTESPSLIDRAELLALQNEARVEGLGIFSRCDADSFLRGNGGGISEKPVVEAQFEPIERTMETVWTEDGGKQHLRTETGRNTGPPANPGDVKGCSDFKSYEDSLQWFETYEPFFGDVAKLDRDGDGIPCPGLPHTSNRDLFRLKVPKISNGNGR